MSRIASFLPMLILLVFSSLISGKGKKGKTTPERKTPSRDYGQTKTPQPAAARTGRAAAKKDSVHWRAAREEECAYGDVNHRYSHNADRRVAQLDGYLKAGLIDRKEYAQMLERYQRMDREAGLD